MSTLNIFTLSFTGNQQQQFYPFLEQCQIIVQESDNSRLYGLNRPRETQIFRISPSSNIFMIKWFASVFMRLRLVHKYRKTGSGDTRRGPRGDTGGHLCVNTWSGHLDSVVGTINQFLIKTLGFCILSDRIWVKLQWSSIICGRQ